MFSTQIPLQTAIFICIGFLVLGLIVCFILLCITCIKVGSKKKSKISSSVTKSISEKNDEIIQTVKTENLNLESNIDASKDNNKNDTSDSRVCYENHRYLSDNTESPENCDQCYSYNECQNTLTSLDYDSKSQDSLNEKQFNSQIENENTLDLKYMSSDSINRDSDSKDDDENSTEKRHSSKSRKNKIDNSLNVNSKYMDNDKRSPIFKNFLLKSDKPFLGYVPKTPLNK